jgi:hypothetical protein
MKIFFNLLLIIAFASHFGTNEIFAQKKAKPKEVIIVKFSLPNWKSFKKGQFPINKTPQGNFDSGDISVSECMDPSNKECTYSSYEFAGRAFAVNKNLAKINFKIEVDDNCKTRRIFTVYRNKETKIRLNCGVSLIAYYGFESKETN